jgi:Undecaprenyl-phosphate glucose phosphotransferase
MEFKKSIQSDLMSNKSFDFAEDLSKQERLESLANSLPTQSFIAPKVVGALAAVGDILIIPIVALAQLALYPGLHVLQTGWLYSFMVFGAAVAMSFVSNIRALYSLPNLLSPIRSLPQVLLSWFAIMLLSAMAILATKTGESVSRAWFLSWCFLGFGWLVAYRYAVAAIVRTLNTNGRFNRRAVLVGGGEMAEQAVAALQDSGDTGVSLLGMFDDRNDGRTPESVRGITKLGTIDDLIGFVRRTRIDTLIVALPLTAEDRLLQIINRLWILPVDIRLSAHAQKLRYRPRAYSYIGRLALLDVFDRPLGDWGPVLKSIEDKTLALLALILLSPVFALVALAVRLDSKGPVFFKQKRYGFNNELVEIYKFRSMFTSSADVDARKLVTKDDPRVTRVGRFIRKTSLDELPQLLNVLKGELSLVGPRPHATKASAAGTLYENVVSNYFGRHRVKPGITGWAQINGWRGETDTAEKIQKRVEHDLYYIENWSLTFDLYILARTPFALLSTENAY